MAKKTVLCDLTYGDNGKARWADWAMKDYHCSVKTNGGPNSGGVVWVKGTKYKLHNIPASILHNKPSYIAPTCLINPERLLKEIEGLKSLGFDVDNNLKVSPHCHVITKDHIDADTKKEEAGQGVGSTKQGISPCSVSKYSRTGKRLFECGQSTFFEKYYVDISEEINVRIAYGDDILFQTSQGTLLDPDWGVYPFVSTTSNTAASAAMACGFGPQYITDVVGILKAYNTYVGSGTHFMTEIGDNQLNNIIAERGVEFGTTTGRRRRIGYLDIPLLHYACQVNGVTELVLTKADVLEGLKMKYCLYYENANGDFVDTMPLLKDLQNYKPVYSEEKVFDLDSLLTLLEEYLGLPVRYISTGPERDQMVVRYV